MRGDVAGAILALILIPVAALAQDTPQAQPLTMPPLPEAVMDELGAVGRVNIAGFRTRGNCTGTLIRPDVVLTAAHCTSADGASDRVFVAGWRRGRYVAARPMADELRHPAYGLGGRHTPRVDLGLLFLDRPITEVAPLPLSPPIGDTVAIAGYHQFIPHLLTGRLDCAVTPLDGGVRQVGCPVTSGNSGGPVLERGPDGGWVVTGVVSSTIHGGGGALVVDIPAWVHEVLSER